jgi:hypothetical protein
MGTEISLEIIRKYPPSQPCSCVRCVSYCSRPGWWLVKEAEACIAAGYGFRMMLEVSPERDFAVLSPAFRGNEGNYALQEFSGYGCTFLRNGLCELFGTGFQPLECRYCHHTREGTGNACHHDIERDWNSSHGKRIIVRWGNITGFWAKQGLIMKEK